MIRALRLFLASSLLIAVPALAQPTPSDPPAKDLAGGDADDAANGADAARSGGDKDQPDPNWIREEGQPEQEPVYVDEAVPQPPPYAEPRPDGSTYPHHFGMGHAHHPPFKRLRIEAGVGVNGGQGDWSDVSLGGGISTTPSLRAAVGYRIHANVDVHVLMRYFAVQFDDELDGFSVSQFDVGVGTQLTHPVTRRVKGFADIEIINSNLRSDDNGDKTSDSGIGIGVRVGLAFMTSHTLGFGVAASYSSANIDFSDQDFDTTWAGLEGSVLLQF